MAIKNCLLGTGVVGGQDYRGFRHALQPPSELADHFLDRGEVATVVRAAVGKSDITSAPAVYVIRVFAVLTFHVEACAASEVRLLGA